MALIVKVSNERGRERIIQSLLPETFAYIFGAL
jgi:hypothetical protein